MTENNNDIFSDFWDLAALLPKKKKSEPVRTSDQDMPQTAEMVFEGERKQESRRKLSSLRPDETLSDEYRPHRSALIESVRLYRRQNSYSFYSAFSQDAHRLLHEQGRSCEYVPFFSYIPQYSQLNRAQLAYYLYWRERVRLGEYIKCDISYLWLFVYEIINLPHEIEPSHGAELLCGVWAAYREQMPKIDKYMTVWLADYCLTNRLPCPYTKISPFLSAILENAGFPEFYLGRATETGEYGTHTLLSLTSAYDWQKSKFIMSLEQSEKRHLLSAMGMVIGRHLEQGEHARGRDELSVLSRDAFSGSLCAHNVKCRIEVTYHSFDHSPTLSHSITAALKYTENKLRALHMQKSRLSVIGLCDEDKALIDGYFQPLMSLSAKKGTARSNETAEYEKLYDAASESMSYDDAVLIENASWKNTELLVPLDTAEADRPAQQAHVKSESMIAAPQSEENLASLQSEESLAALQSEDTFEAQQSEPDETYGLSEGDTEWLARLLASGSLPPDMDCMSACERINEAFTEHFGDIVVLCDGAECSLIEDYREDIEEWLSKQKKTK